MNKELSYHSYQQILDLGQTDNVPKQRKLRKKYTKTRDGCLNCKRRRKKCDEEKPICKGCFRNKLECCWPDHVDINSGKKEVLVQNNGINDIFNNLPDEFAIEDDFLLEQFLDIQTANQIKFEFTPPSSRSNSMSSIQSDSLSSVTAIVEPLVPQRQQIPGVPMSKHDSICYDSFVNKFIKSVSPSHCNPLISPGSILQPFAITSSIVREVFLACGASLLAYNNDSFKAEANERYVSAVNSLIQEIKQSKDACEDHLFICVQLLQTLCLRDKTIGLNGTKSAAHLSASYEIIKKRFAKSSYVSNNLNINPLDKILAEHFVYNYPITIMMCSHGKLKNVPSPFHFFRQFQWILDKPFDQDINDEWLNHPIVGVGLKAHELSGKCSWLCRLSAMPPSQESIITCLNLKEDTLQNLIHLEHLSTDPNLTIPQRANIAYSKSQLYACLIILKKLCNYESTTIADLQTEVDSIAAEMAYCEELEPDFIHSIWTLFIGGSTTLTTDQRALYKRWFKKVADTINSSLCLKILKYLNIIWDEETDFELNNNKSQVGFEFLFDTLVLDIVCT